MADVDELIGNAVIEAGLAETNDSGELVAIEDDAQPEPAAEVVEEPAEGAAGTAEGEKTAETPDEGDDLDRELQGLGIQPKDARGGESRIRYSRIRKIWDNWGKKLRAELEETHGKSTKEFEAKLQAHAERLGYMDNVERLMKTDPRRYVELLLMAQPTFRQFVNPTLFGGAAQPAAGAAQSDADPMPLPDAKFPDGSLGYSPEGLEKRDAWNRRQTMREMEATFEKKYGAPIQNLTQQQRQQVERNMHVQKVQQNVARAKQVYGQAFTDDFGELGNIKADSGILAALKADPKLSFMDACAVALIPKIQPNRDKMREELMAELKERPAAARRSTPAAQAGAASAPQTTEEIIAAEMRKAGML